MKKHLVISCFRFKRAISAELLDTLCVTSEPPPNTGNLQRTIADSMGHALQKLTTSEMNQLAGMALFAGARPFTTFESIEMREFHKALQANPNYKIPSRQQFAESVLDNCYTHVQKQVNELLDKSQYLNVSVTDIRKRRIMNISVTDSKRSFCIALQALNDEKLNAESITNWIVERVRSNQACIYTYY